MRIRNLTSVAYLVKRPSPKNIYNLNVDGPTDRREQKRPKPKINLSANSTGPKSKSTTKTFWPK
jgi:hypothetical protein